MSNGGEGAVVLLPAIGLVAVPVLLVGGLAVVGAVGVAQLGKGVVMCGQRARQAIQDHLARQQAINDLCRQYEQRILREARGTGLDPAELGARHLNLVSRLRVRRNQATARIPEPPLSIPADSGLVEELPPAALFTPGDLEKTANQLASEVEKLEGILAGMEESEWVGLVVVDDLRERRARLHREVENNRLAAGEQRFVQLRDLRQEIRRLRADTAYRANEGQARYQQWSDVAEVLAMAADQLEARAQALGSGVGFSMAEDMLQTADELFGQGDLEGAQVMARSALSYIHRLDDAAEEIRRSNARVAIQALKDYITGLGFGESPAPQALIPLTDQAAALNRHIAKAQDQLDGGRWDDFWGTLSESQREAEQLAAATQREINSWQQNQAIQLAWHRLGEMGYSQIEEEAPRPDGSRKFKAQRSDGAHFIVGVGLDGTLQYEAEGFGTAECQQETGRLFDGLREQGMVANIQSEFNMAAAAERMREILLRKGYDLIREEPSADGRSHTLIGTRRDRATGEILEDQFNVDHTPLQQGESPAESNAQQGAGASLAQKTLDAYWETYTQMQAGQAGRLRN